MRFEIQNNQLFRFLRTNYTISFVILGAMILVLPTSIMLAEDADPRTISIVLGVLVGLGALIFALTIKYARSFTNSLSYEVKDGILYISEGVFTYERKAIPLDRVTDFRLVQGWLMRQFDLWTVQVQTAGAAGVAGAEGTLLAVKNPIEARDHLLKIRDEAIKTQRIEAAA